MMVFLSHFQIVLLLHTRLQLPIVDVKHLSSVAMFFNQEIADICLPIYTHIFFSLFPSINLFVCGVITWETREMWPVWHEQAARYEYNFEICYFFLKILLFLSASLKCNHMGKAGRCDPCGTNRLRATNTISKFVTFFSKFYYCPQSFSGGGLYSK